MLRALGSASSDITHEPGVTISCDITHEKGIRFVTGIGITHETGDTIYYEHWVLRLVISVTRQGLRFVTDIGICIL